MQNKEYENCEDVESDYDVLEEFFSRAFEYKGKKKYEQGRVESIYETILKNYRCKYGDDVPDVLEEKINDIDSYPALEEIQIASWSTASPEAFEQRVDSIIEQYVEHC